MLEELSYAFLSLFTWIVCSRCSGTPTTVAEAGKLAGLAGRKIRLIWAHILLILLCNRTLKLLIYLSDISVSITSSHKFISISNCNPIQACGILRLNVHTIISR